MAPPEKHPMIAVVDAPVDYVDPASPGIRRQKRGKGFCYRTDAGAVIRDADALKRIAALAVPPAWRDVWICASPTGHIQAIGWDAKGRKQYRYQAQFREQRETAKFEHMIAFAEALPAIRSRLNSDLRRHGLPREKVLASVVRLLELTMIRVGNAAYVKDNKSYGLTTLLNRHVDIAGGALKFHFKGKSGKTWRLSLHDRRVANVVKACQDLPGQHLFQYLDEHGERQSISSTDVNAYLKAISGAEITAKDFRTWNGTVLAAVTLAAAEPCDHEAQAKRMINAAIKTVAERLGNTPTVCRKYYVHPQVLSSYLEGALNLDIPQGDGARDDACDLTAEERAVLAFILDRVKRAVSAAA